MLKSLSIRNIVLVDNLQIDFESGLSVLTGETGAGKSILLDALSLALGSKAEPRLIRQGQTTAQVIAVFIPPPSHHIWDVLKEHEIQADDNELIFRRTLEQDGKSKCLLNDQIISQTLMRKLGQALVEVHGQFEGLLDTRAHINALDTFGKIDSQPVKAAYQEFLSAKKDLEEFQDKLSKSLERLTFLGFAMEEIEKAKPLRGEVEALEADRSLIAHRAKIADVIEVVEKSCHAAISEMASSHKALNRIVDLLPEQLCSLIEASDRSLMEIQEVLEGCKNLQDEVNGTPQSLDQIENRIHTLRSLSRKYQCDDLLTCLQQFKEESTQLNQGDDYKIELERKVKEYKDRYVSQATRLSTLRKKAGEQLDSEIEKELPPLKLEHAKFRVKLTELPEENWGPHGFDQVEFYIRTNPGSPEGPIGEVASGGELSRLMLALKAVLVQFTAVPTLIFDEIESGTGGSVASAMGGRLKALSDRMQVLAITHSPQIAVSGDHHFVVYKVMSNNSTTTHVKSLNLNDKQEEIARMLAADEITDEARAAAKSMMGRAR